MNPFPADSVVGQYFPVFLEGAVTTLAIVLAAIVCATVLGYFIALMRLSRFRLLSAVAAVYVWFFRGLPLMLSLFFFYYTQPFGWTFDAFTAGLIPLLKRSASRNICPSVIEMTLVGI